MNTHRAFLASSYQAFRAGRFGSLVPDVSNITLDAWLAEPSVNSPAFVEFLVAHPPRDGEVLVCLFSKRGAPCLVATNLRLWMRNSRRKDFESLEFQEISQYESKCKYGWNFSVTVRTRAGQTKSFRGMPYVLADDLANFLISGPALEPASAAKASNDLEIADNKGTPRGVVGIAAFAFYMFVTWSKFDDAGSAAIVLIGGLLLAFASEQFYRNIYGSPAKKQRGANSPPNTTSVPPEAAEDATPSTVCPNCSRQVLVGGSKCPHCHTSLTPGPISKPIRTNSADGNDA
jgi:hypothetical protein